MSSLSDVSMSILSRWDFMLLPLFPLKSMVSVSKDLMPKAEVLAKTLMSVFIVGARCANTLFYV